MVKKMNRMFLILWIMIICSVVGCTESSSPSRVLFYRAELMLGLGDSSPMSDAISTNTRQTISWAGEMQLPLLVILPRSSQTDLQVQKKVLEVCNRYHVNQITFTEAKQDYYSTIFAINYGDDTEKVDVDVWPPWPFCECQFRILEFYKKVFRKLAQQHISHDTDRGPLDPFTTPCDYNIENGFSRVTLSQSCRKGVFYCQLRFADSEVLQKMAEEQVFLEETLRSPEQINLLMEAFVEVLRSEKWDDEIIVRESWTLKERYRVNRNGFERIH